MEMSLQSHLVESFCAWRPAPPCALARSPRGVTLSWCPQPFGFLQRGLLYRLERREKVPPWVVVYSGGKTTKVIDNLAPSSPHRFRLRVILKASAVPHLADTALLHYGDEHALREHITRDGLFVDVEDNKTQAENNQADNRDIATVADMNEPVNGQASIIAEDANKLEIVDRDYNGDGEVDGDTRVENRKVSKNKSKEDRSNLATDGNNAEATKSVVNKKWLESQWSEELWTSTESDGTSAICFCMAVRGGYLKQMQMMLEERPALIGIINSTNGLTPLATAITKGDISTVRFLLSSGADLAQRAACGRTALHFAALAARPALVDLLLDRGADLQSRDACGLRAEHCAVDSGDVDTLRRVLARGGDVAARDGSGWTPLFRAVCQGADSALVAELVRRGSDPAARDAAGLQLAAAARLLTDAHGRRRESVLRLVDAQFPREAAAAHFTRLTKKICRVHTLFNM